MKINKFKTGDIITRIANANGDYSYTGDKLELIKINTKYIYLKSFQKEDFPHEIIKLELNFWKNGWEYYIDNDSSKLIKDIFDSGKELKLQYDKFSKEREVNGTVFIEEESDYNYWGERINNAKKKREDKCDELWDKLFDIKKSLKH